MSKLSYQPPTHHRIVKKFIPLYSITKFFKIIFLIQILVVSTFADCQTTPPSKWEDLTTKLIQDYGIKAQCRDDYDCVINTDLIAVIFTGRGKDAQDRKMNWQEAKDYLKLCLNTYTRTYNPASGMNISKPHTLHKLCICNNLLREAAGSDERFSCNFIGGRDFNIEIIQAKLAENCILIGGLWFGGFGQTASHAVAIMGTEKNGEAVLLDPVSLQIMTRSPNSTPSVSPFGNLNGMIAKCPKKNLNASIKANTDLIDR